MTTAAPQHHRSSVRTLAIAVTAALGVTGMIAIAPPASAEELPERRVELRSYPVEGEGLFVGYRQRGMPQSFDSDETIRVPDRLAWTIPDTEEFGWLGEPGEAGFGMPRYGAFTLSTLPAEEADYSPLLTPRTPIVFDFSDVVGPGTFSVYEVAPTDPSGDPDSSAPVVDGGRFGTGAQRDGAPQDASPFAVRQSELWGESGGMETGTFFSEPGLYCMTLTTSATMADGSTATASAPLRFAVGGAVSWDAECGATPDGTIPEEPEPEEPEEPSVAEWVIRDGHLDAVGAQIDTVDGASQLALRTKYDVPNQSRTEWVEWDDMVIVVPDSTKKTTPASYSSQTDWSFIGSPGTAYWNLPLSRVDHVPWPGLSTESPTLAALGENFVQWRVDAVTGLDGAAAPGEVSLTSGNPDTATMQDASNERRDFSEANTQLKLPAGQWMRQHVHAHYDWNFTAPGVYCLAMILRADTADGHRLSDAEQLTVVVGDAIDANQVTPCGLTQPYPTLESAATAAVTGDDTVVIDRSHASLVSTLDEDGLDTRIRTLNETASNWDRVLNPEDAIIHHPARVFRASGQMPEGFTAVYGRNLPGLGWDTTGILPEQLDGDIRWSLSEVEGPGEVAVDAGWGAGIDVFNTATGQNGPFSLWAGAEDRSDIDRWSFSRPGKYCVTLDWEASLENGATVSDSRTLTFVVDGPLDPATRPDASGQYPGPSFEHDADTLTVSCADGGKATTPEEVPLPGGENPETPAWEVPNWSDTTSGAKILNLGHVDVASLVEDGELVTKVKDTTTEGVAHATEQGASWHDPEDTVFQLVPAAERQVPDRTQFRFLGEPGTRFWLAPETQNPAILWPGWSTEHIPDGTLQGGMEWRLTAKDGPGDFFLYTSDPQSMEGAQLVRFNTSDGIDEHDVVPVGSRVHVHGNWAFTAEGVYCLAFERTANLADGTPLADAFTLAVAVGETDPTVIDPAHCDATEEPAPTVPVAPAAPQASVNGDTVTVSWEAPADGGSAIAGYTVQLLGGPTPLVREVTEGTTTSFTDVPAGTYTATVTATNAIGSSAASAQSDPVTVSAAVPTPTAPAAPAQPGVSADGQTVSVSWVAPADGGSPLTGFTVTLTSDAGDPLTQQVGAEATAATFTDVPVGVWTATVTATNTVGSSPASAPSSPVTVTDPTPEPEPEPQPTVPAAPAAPASSVQGSTVSVSWVSPADGGSPVTGFTVTLTPQTGEPLTRDTPADTTSAVFTDVPAGIWIATVVADNAIGSSPTSAASAPVTVTGSTPDPDPVVFPVPDDELTDANRGGVQVPDAATPGSPVTVQAGAEHAGEQVRVWLHSTPVLLGAVTLNEAGNVVVTIPASAALGDHKIVVQALDGSLIGWDSIRIGSASQVGPSGEWLASTGSDIGWPIIGIASVLLLLGGLIALWARRRQRDETQ